MENWAHVLWQRHGLRMEEFDEMPKERKLFYIASELEEEQEIQRAQAAAAARR